MRRGHHVDGRRRHRAGSGPRPSALDGGRGLNPLARRAVELDRLIHEPARLTLTALLYAAEEADFLFLLRESGLTRGNLSSHLSKLEEGGYVAIQKGFVGKLPRTVCRLTPVGRQAFERYRSELRKVAVRLG